MQPQCHAETTPACSADACSTECISCKEPGFRLNAVNISKTVKVQVTNRGQEETNIRLGCLPSANNVRQEASQRTSPEVHHSKDGSQVSSLVGREAKLRSQVRCQGVVDGQLHDQGTGIRTKFDGLLQQVRSDMHCLSASQDTQTACASCIIMTIRSHIPQP